MKKIFFLFSLLISQINFAQEAVLPTTNQDDVVYNATGIEVRPEYPGGINEFYKYVGATFNVPSDKKFNGGRIYVSFVVEKDGSLTDIKVVRDAGFGTGEEAVRVLKNSKKWQPAEQNGKKVRCQFMLPIKLMAQ